MVVQALKSLKLCSSHPPRPGYNGIKVQKLIAIGAWYILWLRNCVNYIRAIAASAARANTPAASTKRMVWLKPRAMLCYVHCLDLI
jgi:hypothetical protein